MKKIVEFLKSNYILILICLLFLGTRLFRISEIPSSVYWDEASIGYNAYSVLKTGKDEWGNTLPLHFRAFGEFKLPVYIYSVVISEFFLGMTTVAVRLPSVLYGLMSVVGLYLLIFEITRKKEISLLSSFLFTITPWFFIFSRTGYEAVAGLAFFIWAIYLFLLSLKNKWFIVLSTVFFVLTIYSYNSFRILTPLVLGPMFVYFLLQKRFLPLLVSVLLLVASIVPIYKLYRFDSGLGRLQTVGAKSGMVSNYFKNFSADFLFVNGDSNFRSQIPGRGELYILDSVFIILGIIFILKSKKPYYYLLIYLLLISPIPATLTRENPHALRSILASPIFAVASAMGVYFFLNLFKKDKNLAVIIIVGLYILSFENYFYIFGTEYNKLSRSAWQYEYKEIFETQKEGCVSDEYAQPYIFALYYNKYSPLKFIQTKKLNPVNDWGFSTVYSFGNYIFPKSCKK